MRGEILKRWNRKQILMFILALMIVSGAAIGGYYWYRAAHYVETEDARIAGDIYRIMPRVTGKISSLTISVGDTVLADQIVGRQEVAHLTNDMLDQATLRAPITGTVIQTSAKVGEIVSPGQPVAMIVDKQGLYVSANIEETDIQKVKVGQVVEFTVDAFPGYRFSGKVFEIGGATTSTFALLPTVSTSGTFTKVTQRIPVKISIDDQQGLNLSPGMNAAIKIHIK